MRRRGEGGREKITNLSVAHHDRFLRPLLLRRLNGIVPYVIHQLGSELVFAVRWKNGETTELGEGERKARKEKWR